MNLDQFNRGNRVAISFKACFLINKLFAKSILILVFACFIGPAMAQHRSTAALTYGGGSNGDSNFESGYGITFGVGYDLPLDYLKDIYKPTVAYNFGVSRFLGDFTVGLNLGYHAYKPKDDLVSVVGNNDGTTETTDYSAYFSKLKVFEGYASGVYNIDLTEGARLYGGLNLGLYYTENTIPYFTTDDTVVPLEQHIRNFYVAPRLGLIFSVSNQIGITLDGKYNFYTPITKSQYDTSSGSFYTSIAFQAGVVVKL
ncbi:hypothetical protein [Mucilaginibacter aquaedulcis]|uniref:hypothetical protein n=1 Tax=Mucilaginibacter aquaedulcis TaxID=1187081 RepID=UPI0025B346FA|nr:hypothetical protein [Mucilaginibacter aquaedulcis]MDN3547225.1 hypothetical protein [Mucilaginibacter aquaedulcis]